MNSQWQDFHYPFEGGIKPDISNIVAVHLREHFRYIGSQSGLTIVEKQGFISISKEPTNNSYNYVLGVNPIISIKEYKDLVSSFKEQINTSFAWFSYPSKQDLEQVLSEEGLQKLGALTGIYYEFAPQNLSFYPAIEAKIVPVSSQVLFDEWCRVHAQVWSRPIESTQYFFQGLNPQRSSSKQVYLFLAEWDGEYIGSCALDIQGQVAGCYWDCVLPQFRKKGVGTLMVQERIRQAKGNGCPIIVAQCLNSSLQLYRQLGFKECCDFALFRYAGV